MYRTKIDYATHSWNPVWGCRKDCPYCYARRFAQRIGVSFDPHWIERNFARPMPREPGARIFVNSMSDIAFWKPAWMCRVLDEVDQHHEHAYLFLTKVVETYHRYDPWPTNCWLGVTATTISWVKHAQPVLGDLPGVHFLSIEPIQEHIEPDILDPNFVDWVIVGAETGNRTGKHIPTEHDLRCLAAARPRIFFKSNLPPGDYPVRREYPNPGGRYGTT